MSEAQFRIGGVYRQRNGQLVELAEGSVAVYLSDRKKYGPRDPRDGSDLNANIISKEWGDRSLLPGELTLVNGSWVPLGVTEEPKQESELDRAVRHLASLAKPAPEPVRPPLDWNKPTSTDRFPGFAMASQAPSAYDAMPPSAMDWLTSTEPHGAASREWRDGWDACRNFVSMRVRDAERTNGVTEVQRAEAELEEMRQHGDVDDATEAAAHLERVRHNHGVVESGTTPGNDHFAYLDHSSPLQRMTDPSDPLHGSAHLRKG